MYDNLFKKYCSRFFIISEMTIFIYKKLRKKKLFRKIDFLLRIFHYLYLKIFIDFM